MSIGGYFPRDQSGALSFVDFFQRVVDYASERGVLLIAAAGNEAVNTNTASSPSGSYSDSLEMPAGARHVMSIGATGPINQTAFDTIAVYSNYGDAGVGVFAPGGNVTGDNQDLVIGACSSAIPQADLCPGAEDVYLIGAGTSFATPMVSGEAAVVEALSASVIKGQALETCILNTATEINPGVRPDPLYNFGRIDVLKAITTASCQ
jgi:subtilisin family serine protease